jgi:hypothetical protein
VFDNLAALVENVWPLRYAGLHSIQYGLVLEFRVECPDLAREQGKIEQDVGMDDQKTELAQARRNRPAARPRRGWAA